MSKNPPFYSPAQRRLQAEFDCKAFGSRLEELIVKPELDDSAQSFVQTSNCPGLCGRYCQRMEIS